MRTAKETATFGVETLQTSRRWARYKNGPTDHLETLETASLLLVSSGLIVEASKIRCPQEDDAQEAVQFLREDTLKLMNS